MDGIRGVGPGAGNLYQQWRYMLQAIRDVRGGTAGTAGAGAGSAATGASASGAGTQTTLNYKLDPGERGLLQSASPADSQAAVTAQEQMNVHRLSAEAMARGERVVSVDVGYKAAIVDGQLAILAGHTEVVSVPLPGAAEESAAALRLSLSAAGKAAAGGAAAGGEDDAAGAATSPDAMEL